MYLFLLKKALPFTLTFILGAALSALVGSLGGGKSGHDFMHLRHRGGEHGRRRRACRMRPHQLVAESKPLAILDKPVAWRAWGNGAGSPAPVRMLVTFGADGTVQDVEQFDRFELPQGITEGAKRAAWRIKFEPEKVNGLPVTVKREVEINFASE